MYLTLRASGSKADPSNERPRETRTEMFKTNVRIAHMLMLNMVSY
jgi:hypothetical protein